MMWSSSEGAPPVLIPVNIGDARWSGELSAPHSPLRVVDASCGSTVSIDSLSSGGELDRMLKERFLEQEEDKNPKTKHPVVQQQRGRTVGRKRAVLGAVRRLLSRSRSASKDASRSVRERSVSLDYARRARASTTAAEDGTTSYNSEPAPRRLFSAGGPNEKIAAASTAAAAAAARREDSGCSDDRPRSDRLGREENFHLAMDNKLVHMFFAAFCKKTFAAENIEFVRQVREVDKLSTAEGTTTSELREKLRHVAAEFVSPESATEVNVDGSSREDALCSIQAALEAAGTGGSQRGGGGESPWAWVLAVQATEALVELARELHTVIFDGLWPRFLTSDEFTVMMNTEEMRTVGFTDLDGKLVVSALPPQHPGGGVAGSRSSMPNKRQLSSRLASSFRATRLVSGGGGRATKDSAAIPGAEGPGGAENVPSPKNPASSAPAPVHGSGSGRSLDIVEAATAAAAAAATTKATVTPTARPPLGRPSLGRAAFAPFSRPPRTATAVQSKVDSSGNGGGGRRQVQRHHARGGFSARWVAAGRARRREASGGGDCSRASGRGGAAAWGIGSRRAYVSSPASPASPTMIGRARLMSSPFASAAAEQRAFSLR